jgi:peptidoglycan/xylan/chitin deacetylase (PgdA/CDA1 family)
MRKIAKYFFHNILCAALLHLQVHQLLLWRTRHRRLIVMYHGVRKTHQRINGRNIRADHFERQIRFLKKHFDIVPLDTICSSLNNSSRRQIAITFDDGLLNNFTIALPILIKHQVPATFFICSAAITDLEYLHPSDMMDVIRMAAPGRSLKLRDETFTAKGAHLLDNAGKSSYEYLHTLSFRDWLAVNKVLFDACRDRGAFNMIDEELYQLARDPQLQQLPSFVSLGSHSHHHVNLTKLLSDELDQQLQKSKATLGALQPITVLAFPYGEFNGNVIKAAQRAGYTQLIAGGKVPEQFRREVFPRIGVLDGAGFPYVMMSLFSGFKRFGF